LYDSGVGDGGMAEEEIISRGFSSMRWPLPKPLYMPAGDALQCSLRLKSFPALAEFGFGLARANVTYIGRLAGPGTPPPAIRHVPWVSSYQQLASTAFGQTNDEFRNPFSDKPWYVQRFTSRVYISTISSDLLFAEWVDASSTTHAVEARLYDSLGYAIVPNFTPAYDVFDGPRAAWTFGRTLGPREQFDLQLRTVDVGDIPEGTDYITQVGVVGFREERT
jgi:hypothetical protein